MFPFSIEKNTENNYTIIVMNDRDYIKKSIQRYYSKRILSPIIFIMALAVLFVFFPLGNMMLPRSIDLSETSIEDYNKEHSRYLYITTTFDTLYFTGYRETFLSRTTGYYYYTMTGDTVNIVLLTPKTSQEGIPTIEDLTLNVRILKDKSTRDELLGRLANDLSWTSAGIESQISPILLSEPDATGTATSLLKAAIVIGLVYALLSLLAYILWIARPTLSPPITRLAPYGHPSRILQEAEEELSTLPQLATDDMFITEHYFIETSDYGVAVVPIDQIIWIYKYSTLHKFLWIHFAISYTLNINAGKHQYIRCPKNTKTDIDGIMDYLAEANHDILVGFTEENRKLALRRAKN